MTADPTPGRRPLPRLTVPQRLTTTAFDLDEDHPHIHVDQERTRAAGFGPVLVAVCPAHVYAMDADGDVSVEVAACLECGTCRAVAPPGCLDWHYPPGGKGVRYREG